MDNVERTERLSLMVSRYMRSPEVLAEMGVNERDRESKLRYAAVMIATCVRLSAVIAASTFDAEDKIMGRLVNDRTNKIQPATEKFFEIIKGMK